MGIRRRPTSCATAYRPDPDRCSRCSGAIGHDGATTAATAASSNLLIYAIRL